MWWSSLKEEARILIIRKLDKTGEAIIPLYDDKKKVKLTSINRVLMEHLRLLKQGYDEIRSDRFFSFGGASGIRYTSKLAWLDENGIVEPQRRKWYCRMWMLMESIESSILSKSSKKKD